ncbi:amino acid adenylation domain-containing protein [Actinoplanes ianthinogenes]|nr:amino acid adenylation domain-containing protein [Actinoplanes ianthinogenes]
MPARQSRPRNPVPPFRDSTASAFPLSAGQERMWWLRQLDSSHDQYHISCGWRFPAEVNREALLAALDALVRRHEILRTKFVMSPDGTVTQEIVDHVEIPLVWAGPDWREAVEQAAVRPFDLARPPLVRAVAAELADGPGLLVTMHHIITDRWSMDVFARDLFELYEAALTARTPRLPELPVQYGDYARWQRDFLTDDLLRSQLNYWTEALAGYEPLELPLDRPRPTTVDAVGETVVLELSREATAAMTALAWRTRASPAMVVSAAFVATLRAFCGQSDVVIGAIVSDRTHPDLRDLIGFFINTMILRVDLTTTELTFREAITRTRDAWMAADAHQDARLEQIVGALNAGSEAHRNPIFDVVVNHAGDRDDLAEDPDAPVWWEPDLPVTARFDLSLTTRIVEGRLRATFVYPTALFNRATIATLADRYLRTLEQGVATPDAPMRDFDLLTRADRTLLRRGNDRTPASGITVVERLQTRAARTPDAPAVVGDGGPLSYGQLNERANRLARHLLTLGVGPEKVVGVCLERTVERFVVLLALAKCGAPYLPVDPDFPADRIRLLMSDAAAVLMIVGSPLLGRLPSMETPVLTIGDGSPDLTGYATDNLPTLPAPDSLAYLISTSGSTGNPKSVAISHRALSRLVEGAPHYLEVGPGSVFLQTGPLTFDVAVLEWAPLAHGGRVVVADPGSLLDGLRDVLCEHQVTTLKLVSPQLDILVEQDPHILSGLRQLVVGGDVVNPRSFALVEGLLPGCRVVASYGPTECTVLATVFEGGPWSGRVPIGRPIPHTSAYILDEDLQPVSVGMRGEIFLAGDGLARGYHARPGLTAASFVPDPFGPPGSRMYRTGDLGRYLPNGAIDFLGRTDHQVKIRGFRIETSEVEHALLRHPDITAAAVVRATLATGPALVAYIVAARSVDMGALRDMLRETLPAYMRPDHFVTMPRFTLTAHNKIDRAALPPVTTATTPAGVDLPPATGLEARVVAAWSAVLGRPLSASDDFFDQGGHSLLVPRATATLRRELGREVPLQLMLEYRTPASYATAILRESLPDLSAASREDRLVQRTWRGEKLAGRRRVDLFISTENPLRSNADLPLLIVLDGSEFVEIMRLPAILDRLSLQDRIPTTAAIFLSPSEWSTRRSELLDDGIVDALADELLPYLRTWLGNRPVGRAVVVGASLGAVTAIRSALRRPDRFHGAVAISGPLSEHRLGPARPGRSGGGSRFFLSASREEKDIILDDGLSLVEATERTADELAADGHVVRSAIGEGGHTYAAWESMLPDAIRWSLGDRT